MANINAARKKTVTKTPFVVQNAPIVYLRVAFRNAHYNYIASTYAGRHNVFPAATDGTHCVRDGDALLFSLPVSTPIYDSVNLEPGLASEQLNRNMIEAIALAADSANKNFSKDGQSATDAFLALSSETQALMAWFACRGGDLLPASATVLDLEPWRQAVIGAFRVILNPKKRSALVEMVSEQRKKRRGVLKEAAQPRFRDGLKQTARRTRRERSPVRNLDSIDEEDSNDPVVDFQEDPSEDAFWRFTRREVAEGGFSGKGF
jgi:hypothetical protein